MPKGYPGSSPICFILDCTALSRRHGMCEKHEKRLKLKDPIYREKRKKQQKERYKRKRKYIRDQVKRNRPAWYKRLKDMCYKAYGGYKCACCNITEPSFLTFDHIRNDGAKFRAQEPSGGKGAALYRWIIKNNFPIDMFQVLCWNCNSGRALNNGICPHKKEEQMTGDALAKGAIRAQFPPAGGSVSQEKWDEAIGDFDAERYRRNANVTSTRVPSVGVGETEPNPAV